MGTLILVRHGETEKNLSRSLHASDDLESLNATGVGQIKMAARRLKDFSPSIIYSSKEKRAIQSAQIVSEMLEVPVEIIDGMQERNWGVFTGKPWMEVQRTLTPTSLEERYEYVPQNGESWKTFETRLKHAIQILVKQNRDKTIVVMTHAETIRALMPFLLDAPRKESFKYDPENASLTIFQYDDDGFHKITVNDTSHLS